MKPLFVLSFVAIFGFSFPLAAASAIVAHTDIPFGNATNLRVTRENKVPTVRFTPHPHGGPEALWFCFRVAQIRPADRPLGRVRVILESPDTLLGGGRPSNFRPVFRPVGAKWQRADKPDLVPLPDGRVEVAWTFRVPTSSFDIAFSYPYGRNELHQLIRDTADYWRLDTIGVSQGGRPLWRLSNDYGSPQGQRPGVYLLARQHSGEVSASWVLDGVLRRFAELKDHAPLAWVVPLANIDGVEQGDYGKDNFPYDLNRAWGGPPMRHEVLVVQKDLRRWVQRCRPIACFDFHAPGASESEGIYTYVNSAETVAGLNLEDLAGAFAESLGEEFAAQKFARSADYKSRWETPRFTHFCQGDLGVPALTFEIPYALIGETAVTREVYQEAGRRIADAIAERVVNLSRR